MAWEAQPVGQLATLIDLVQTLANEPRLNAKFPGYRLYPLLRANYREILNEILRLSDTPFVVQFDIAVSNGTNNYMLPPNVGTLLRLFEKDTNTGLAKAEYWNYSKKNSSGPFFKVAGNMLQFIPNWTGGTVTLTIEYIPNGNCHLAFGTINPTSGGFSTTTAKLSTSPDEGYFDRAPNAYLGSWYRLLTASHNPSGYSFWPTQERIVTGYTSSGSNTPKITVSPAFDFDPSAVTSITSVTYEVVPDGFSSITPTLALRTAMMLHRMEGNVKRASEMQKEYISKMRDVRLAVSSIDAIRGNRFEHDTTIGYDLSDLWTVF